jgi:hypothetical protein
MRSTLGKMKMRTKAILITLAVLAFAGLALHRQQLLPKVREVKEVSMLKFLYFQLSERRSTHLKYPQSIEAAFADGILDDFPEDRIDYLMSALEEGRLHYSLSQEGEFTITLITCRNRTVSMESFPN